MLQIPLYPMIDCYDTESSKDNHGHVWNTKRNKSDLLKKTENEIDEEYLENLIVPEGKSLAETVNVSKNINSETLNVELSDNTILDEETKEEILNID